MTRNIQRFTAIATLMLGCAVTLAQEPVSDIDAKLHPHLSAAQKAVVQANREITTAQRDNHEDMKDHAEKARQLLVQVNQELKAAAEAANAANAAKKKK